MDFRGVEVHAKGMAFPKTLDDGVFSVAAGRNHAGHAACPSTLIQAAESIEDGRYTGSIGYRNRNRVWSVPEDLDDLTSDLPVRFKACIAVLPPRIGIKEPVPLRRFSTLGHRRLVVPIR